LPFHPRALLGCGIGREEDATELGVEDGGSGVRVGEVFEDDGLPGSVSGSARIARKAGGLGGRRTSGRGGRMGRGDERGEGTNE
jgi:hypothetical protein